MEAADRLPTSPTSWPRPRGCAAWRVRTPLLESEALNEPVGGRAAEGRVAAAHRLVQVPRRLQRDQPARRGRRGRLLVRQPRAGRGARRRGCSGMPATIVMPADAPAIKLENTRALGAEVVLYDRAARDREAIGGRDRRRARRGAGPAYDDPLSSPGRARSAWRSRAGRGARDATLDQALVPCGGGGLVAGCALALTARVPASRSTPSSRRLRRHARSLAAGTRRQRAGRPLDLRRAAVADARASSPSRSTAAPGRRPTVERRGGAGARWRRLSAISSSSSSRAAPWPCRGARRQVRRATAHRRGRAVRRQRRPGTVRRGDHGSQPVARASR